MIEIRAARQRGQQRSDWLDSWHSFSFASYYDPQRMGHSDLRVINEDVVAPHTGFGAHPHRDMEILTYVMSGAISHRDSQGNKGEIRAGDIQLMGAGSGITHSEINAGDEPVHLLQIWIEPAQPGGEPSYADAALDKDALAAGPVVIAGTGSAMPIRQDVAVWAAHPPAGACISLPLDASRSGYLHVATGALDWRGKTLQAGDALAVSDESGSLDFAAIKDARVLWFDLRGEQ